jgi:cytochrome c biogenesis protein CcmG/thiol:disulfide interchange protein DsbE
MRMLRAGMMAGLWMRWSLRAAYGLVAGCVLVTGCDRGTHPGQIGQPAPVFALNDGLQSVDLAKLRGHVVVLNFWATWCAPCIEEMPSLEALQLLLPQVDVVMVASDETFTEYQSYLERRPMKLLTVFDEKQTSNALYGSFRYPETYIIDKQGVVRRKLIGPQEFGSPEIVNQLKKLASE